MSKYNIWVCKNKRCEEHDLEYGFYDDEIKCCDRCDHEMELVKSIESEEEKGE